jgi:23S rRNA (adenine1618-N6)-methyltransferase
VHPRNRHKGRYDFGQLTKSCPDLTRYVLKNPHGDFSIDFADPLAVKTLNRALLQHFYGVSDWDVPDGYLCPPVPGRADYIHTVADLLTASNDGVVPRGEMVHVLDVGVGANCIYPIIGHREYRWKFLGSDIDPVALASVKRIVDSNPELERSISFRLQKSRTSIFEKLLLENEQFDVTICNPPFHASLEEAQAGSRRKWNNLGLAKNTKEKPVLNFGGNDLELWCEGGEAAFVQRMIEESAMIPTRAFWFTSLMSKETNLPGIYHALKKARALDIKTINLAQGQKISRIVAWTFLSPKQQDEWRLKRWK